ncbi:MAG: PilC/PilY family type IV pilus protein [Rhodocyclaceae bacterium]|nr:PilC/PilY family type IV pilus protein [Rhodocyclaceae bacterium]
MKIANHRRFVALFVTVALVCTQAADAIALTIANSPLAASTTTAVRPNLMYVLDDSGSMAWDYTPDYINDATVTDPTNAGVGPPGSAGDTGQVTIADGEVATITAIGGNSYYEQPTVVIEGGGGTGAAATANWNSSTKKITSVTVTSGGTGYTSAPYVTFVGKLVSAAWGMCWGTTATSNQGGTPKDTSAAPTCTSNQQVPYATSAVNYQYYDPSVRYLLPYNADGTQYPTPSPTSASSDGFLGGTAKNLTTSWTHEIWCNTATPSPAVTSANIATHAQCKENTDTTGDNLYPNATFNFRKTYTGAPFYFTMGPSEYCTDDRYTNCVRATTPQVNGSIVFNLPANYRWCSYYNSTSHAFGGCQGRRDWTHYIPNYLGGWVSTGSAGVQATAGLTINSVAAGQSLTSVTINGADVVGGYQFVEGASFDYSAPDTSRVMSTATDIAKAVCQKINEHTDATGYGCAQNGNTVTLQASIVGTAANGYEVRAIGPGGAAAAYSTGRITVLNPPTSGFQITGITINGNQLISATVTSGGDTGNTARAICEAINSGPNQSKYRAKSGNPADPTQDWPADPTSPTAVWPTCQSTSHGVVGIMRIIADATDNGQAINVTGPGGGTTNTGTITIASTGNATTVGDITLNGTTILTTHPLSYPDGTQTTAIAADIASRISVAGCTAASYNNVITLTGSCTGTLAAVAGTTTLPQGVLRVSSTGNTYRATLGGVKVDTATIAAALTASDVTNGSLAITNATTLKTKINASGLGFTATGPFAEGTALTTQTACTATNGPCDLLVTAPNASYSGKSFTILDGADPTTSTTPTWVFDITDATANSKVIAYIRCGTTNTVTTNTATTGTSTYSAPSEFIANLTTNSATNGLNGRSANGYSWSCATAGTCVVTGPIGNEACANLTLANDASITATSALTTDGSDAQATWTFNITGATTNNKDITGIACGGTATQSAAANTGTASPPAYATALKNSLMSAFDPDGGSHWLFGGGASSYCTPNDSAGTVACHFTKENAACSNTLQVSPAVGSGLTVTSGPTLTGTAWDFTISGANGPNKIITSIACDEATTTLSSDTFGNASSGSNDSASTRAATLATNIIDQLSSTYWYDDSNSSCTSGSGSNGTVTCSLKPKAGQACDHATATSMQLSQESGDDLSLGTPSWNAGTGKWEFTITNVTKNDNLTAIRCGSSSTATYRAVGDNATTGTVNDTSETQRVANLASALNANDSNGFNYVCSVPAYPSITSTCTVTGPSSCASSVLDFGYSASSGISIGGSLEPASAGSRGADAAAVAPRWTLTVSNATTENKTIDSISCAGLQTFDTTLKPTTGTATSTAATQRVENLVHNASTGLESIDGTYAYSCTTASPSSRCTVTGPTGSSTSLCAASSEDSGCVAGRLRIRYPEEIVLSASGGTYSDNSGTNRTLCVPVSSDGGAGSAGSWDNLGPGGTNKVTQVSPFTGGVASQGMATTNMASTTTGVIATSTQSMSNGAAPSGQSIPTNATGTEPNVLVMSGGAAVNTATNHWQNVGVFRRIDIVPGATFNRSSGRTDCVGTACSYTEELQNFANWYTYYRTRMQMMKSASTVAFQPLSSDYRIGFDRICNSGSTTVVRGVAQFGDTSVEVANQKSGWWSNLTGTTSNCATPLRKATAKIGRYYAGLPTTSDPVQYSCQQNFMILVTDGYWNENEPSGTTVGGGDIGNVDNNVATAVQPFWDGAQASTTCPATGSGRGSNASSCRTLADVAWYYYSTDLRSTTLNTKCIGGGTSCADGSATDVSINNVLTTADDKNQAQHMSFFAMGLGIDGTLEYRSDYLTAGIGDFNDVRAGTKQWPAVANLDPTGVDDLWHATVNGHGKYFSARNLPNVVAGLREALNKIGARVGSAAAAATSNLEPVEGDNFAYVASYATLDWVGDLQSRTIDTTSGTVSASTACVPADPARVGCQWSAQAQLDGQTWSARRIYTAPSSGSGGVAVRNFEYSALSTTEKAYFDPSTLSQGPTLVGDPNLTDENLVKFLRGDRSLEQDGEVGHAQIWRFRTHVLGDIVNTQPVFAKAPSRSYSDAGYASFKTTYAARRPVVFVSAQDGMLHAINAHAAAVTVAGVSVQPGQEMWAYVPQQAMASMAALADVNYSHRYFVDGPITVADVNFGSGDNDWHTILVGGLGGGGTSYFALDVTDPLAPTFLWEFTHIDLGTTFGNPVVTKLPSGEWVVMFSSGYNNNSGGGDGGGYLFAVNPQTGVLKSGYPVATGSGTAGAPSNLGKISVWADNPASDNTGTHVYAGDLNGDLWRFDLSDAALDPFKLAHLESGGVAQPITTKVELTTAPNGERMVIVGTGKYLEASDVDSTDAHFGDVQSLYAMKDTMGNPNKGGASQETWAPQTDTLPSDATAPMFLQSKLIEFDEDGDPLTRTDAFGVTSTFRKVCNGASATAQKVVPATDPVTWECDNEDTTTLDWDIHGGWYVSFPNTGERMNVDLKLTQGTLAFATNIPAATSCTVGGSAWFNYLDYATGGVVGGGEFAGQKIPDSLVVGITVINVGGVYKAIVTKSNYQQETLDVPTVSGSSTAVFQNKRSLWREVETY